MMNIHHFSSYVCKRERRNKNWTISLPCQISLSFISPPSHTLFYGCLTERGINGRMEMGLLCVGRGFVYLSSLVFFFTFIFIFIHTISLLLYALHEWASERYERDTIYLAHVHISDFFLAQAGLSYRKDSPTLFHFFFYIFFGLWILKRAK